jgi:hypothetical protein
VRRLVAVVMPGTKVGVRRFLVVPSLSWPKVLSPRTKTVLAEVMARLCRPPWQPPPPESRLFVPWSARMLACPALSAWIPIWFAHRR